MTGAVPPSTERCKANCGRNDRSIGMGRDRLGQSIPKWDYPPTANTRGTAPFLVSCEHTMVAYISNSMARSPVFVFIYGLVLSLSHLDTSLSVVITLHKYNLNQQW